ncbi:GNAT family N-acetyltransferase [Hoeflea ulvae]|uniref:N-acetyltransferase n=1 Tax=Hoeflea ulvae TaxID=2983764 RepID=A0ABT3YJH5_9HYPH|nr:N-acetyltransferase [Hoeflea ulvae]MCY0096052.1 N-acetyltransferase [Hoeflea ulvae]
MTGIDIRPSGPGDLASIERIYPDAFPEEDLLPLVRQLLTQEPAVLSLVAGAGHEITGHILFTPCGITGSDTAAALLAPLAVARKYQRQGIGTALIAEGLSRLRLAGVTRVYVLGDPAYYGRSGFEPETAISPPYPLPEQWRDAWQSVSLDTSQPPARGTLLLPEPWMQPALWAP